MTLPVLLRISLQNSPLGVPLIMSAITLLLPLPTLLNGTTVFADGLGQVRNYRIPAIVQTPSSLVAFAEARDGGDSSASRIAVRSSADGGVSWSDVVFAAGTNVSKGPAACESVNITACRVGNPAVVYDTITKEVVLTFVIRGFDAGEDALGNGMVTSADGGLTWSTPRNVSAGFGVAAGSMPGPGTALQLVSGSTAGRLLVASHHGAYERDYVSISDDHGLSWRTINQSFPAMDEAALTQLPNGSVLLNMRHRASPSKGRAIALSQDGGDSFGPITFDPALVSPVCQASIVSFGGATYFSNPASTSGRNHLTIRKSIDDAATWSEALLVEAGNSAGYSCLVNGELQGNADAAGFGGILYEATDGTIKFSRFPLAF